MFDICASSIHLPKVTTYTILFREMVYINYYNLIKITVDIFWEKTILALWAWHKPEALNTKYESTQLLRSQ
jgi:hypothetical protein